MCAKFRFSYEGLEQITLPRDERNYYLHFVVRYKSSIIIDFYTNKDFEGLFTKDEYYGTYHQWKGTCQFSLAHGSVASARKQLQKMALSRVTFNG